MMRITREESSTSAASARRCTAASRRASPRTAGSWPSTCTRSARTAPTRHRATRPAAAASSRSLYQPEAMRSRAITVLTNTPPRRAQSQPGGLQAIMIFEPVMAKAARKLGIDQVAIRRINAPEGKAKFGPPNREGQQGYATSAFIKEALDRGKEVFGWDERKARSASGGPKVAASASRSAASSPAWSADGLFGRPAGKMHIQSGVGNLGTESASTCTASPPR